MTRNERLVSVRQSSNEDVVWCPDRLAFRRQSVEESGWKVGCWMLRKNEGEWDGDVCLSSNSHHTIASGVKIFSAGNPQTAKRKATVM